MALIRIDKFLSEQGIGSRSDVKKYIKSGRVFIDDKACLKPEIKLDPEKNKVYFDKKEVNYQKNIYIMLNKPAGVISATEDKNDKTVLDLISAEDKIKNIFPVGRLDKDTVGLLILTNDGVFAHNTLSPKKHIDKTYYVEIDGIINETDLEKFKQGIIIVDKGEKVKLKSADLKIISPTSAEVVISEGKFHQIKKMFATLDKRVIYLKRIKFGDITLDTTLKEGEYRLLNETEMEYIKQFIY